jgi:hypothetical protein
LAISGVESESRNGRAVTIANDDDAVLTTGVDGGDEDTEDDGLDIAEELQEIAVSRTKGITRSERLVVMWLNCSVLERTSSSLVARMLNPWPWNNQSYQWQLSYRLKAQECADLRGTESDRQSTFPV